MLSFSTGTEERKLYPSSGPGGEKTLSFLWSRRREKCCLSPPRQEGGRNASSSHHQRRTEREENAVYLSSYPPGREVFVLLPQRGRDVLMFSSHRGETYYRPLPQRGVCAPVLPPQGRDCFSSSLPPRRRTVFLPLHQGGRDVLSSSPTGQ